MTELSDRKPSEKKVLSIRIDAGDQKILDAICEELAQSQSKVIRDALHAYAGTLRNLKILG
jgi:hypothetical protein